MNLKNHLPKEWYIVRLNFLFSTYNQIPKISLGKHSGCDVLRIYSSHNKYKEVSRGSKKWDEYYNFYKTRMVLESEIEALKVILKTIYEVVYEKEKSKYVIINNSGFKLNQEFFEQLKDSECNYPNDTEYNFGIHKFRSRLEMVVAQVAEDLHLTYKYDCGINLYTNKSFGDFFFGFPEFDRCVCLEVMGSLDNGEYIKRSSKKFFEYSMAGYIYGTDWFILGADSNHMPSIEQIRQTLINIVSVLCINCVREVKPEI